MTKTDYLKIRAALRFQRRFGIVLLVLGADLAVFALGLSLIAAGGPGGYLVAQLLFVVVFFHSFVVLHDCGHGSASSLPWLNTLTGHYVSLFCFMPYFPWKYLHNEHHVWAGNVHRDATLAATCSHRDPRRLKNRLLRLAWMSWLPAIAFVRNCFLWAYPLTLPRDWRNRGRLLPCLASVIVPTVVYLGLFIACPAQFHPLHFAPAFVLYFMVTELANLPFHIGIGPVLDEDPRAKLPVWQHDRLTRSCRYPALVARFLMLNFNLHTEHHLFPNLPWYELERARNLVRAVASAEYQESNSLSWSIANRRRDVLDVFLHDCPAAKGADRTVPPTQEGPHKKTAIPGARFSQAEG
jgi:fatty acid desaturase